MSSLRFRSALALFLLLVSSVLHGQQEWQWRFVAGGATVGAGAFAQNGYYYFVAEDRYLYALDRNGVMVWRTDLERRPTGSVVVGPDGSIYVTLDSGSLLALNQDGRLIWRARPTSSRLFAPVVSDTGVIVVADESGTVVALNHRGVELWRTELGAQVSAAPIAGFNATLVFATDDAFLHELSFDGSTVRRQFVNEEASIVISGTEAYYLGSPAGRILKLKVDLLPLWRADIGSAVRHLALGESGDLWVTADNQTLSRVTGTGTVAWKADFAPATPGAPVATTGVLVPVSSGLLSELNPAAELVRQLRLPSRPVGLVVSPRGTVILTTDQWITYAWQLGTVPSGAWAQMRGSFTRAGVPVGVSTGRVVGGPFTESASYLLLRSQLLGPDESSQRVALARIRERVESPEGLNGRYFAYLDLVERVAGSPYFGPLSESGPRAASRRAREEAVSLLATMGDLHTARFLSRLLSYEPDPAMQASIMRAIAEVGSELDSLTVRYLDEIIRRDTSRGPQDRVASAVISLVRGLDAYQGRYIDPAIADVLIRIATANYGSGVRQQALATLRALAGASEL